MSIVVARDGNGIALSVTINGEELENRGDEENEVFIVPKGLLKKMLFKEMPKRISFELCDKIEDDMIYQGTTSIEISKISNSKAYVHFEESGRRKFWDGDVGYKLYMETKRDIIKAREKEIGDVKLEDYDDDGDYIFLNFSTEIESETFDGIITSAEQLVKEIEGTFELTLGSPFKNVKDVENEDFSLSIVIPILHRLGFSNIRYLHGKREFGKDIVFTRKNEFDYFEFWGAQVKRGDVSGKAKSDIDQIIGQIDDAFKIPFYDLLTKQRERISKLLVVISGHYTENAIEKICEKIESNALKNNVIFIDREKINALCSKFSMTKE